MSIDVKCEIDAYKKLGLNPEKTGKMQVVSVDDSRDYVELMFSDGYVFVKASDLIVAVHNAINKNHLR